MAGQYLGSVGVDLDSIMHEAQFGIDRKTSASTQAANRRRPVTKILRARVPHAPVDSLFDISFSHGKISSVEKYDKTPENTSSKAPGVIDANGGLCCPSFCHAHVHLDKCFLLADPKFADLEMVSGDFAEAMNLTGQAKNRFDEDDLLRRGRRLIRESVVSGVTHMRAFVEVDEVVGLKCIDAALMLKEEYKDVCEVQICAFAQLALFSGPDGGYQRRKLLEEALKRKGIDVVGSTPYVEDCSATMQENIEWTIEAAIRTGKHLDFHLDYNLDGAAVPAVWFVLAELERQHWPEAFREPKKVTLGHCTRLSLFVPEEWQCLVEEIGELPVSFVGLPTSDLFMMGRPDYDNASGRMPRGTLPVLTMIRDYGLNCAIAINNIGNCFTPQGSCNLLPLASLGVAVYQAGTKKAVELLFETISCRARAAIGLGRKDFELDVGSPADLVIFNGSESSTSPNDVFGAVILPDSATIHATVYKGFVTSPS